MPFVVKSTDFAQAVADRVKTDPKFTGGRSYADLLIWTRLCAPLTNSEIFSLLPMALRNVWNDEDCVQLLKERGAQKPDHFNIQSLAANLVCFRRNDAQGSEIHNLKEQLSQLSHEFNTLSYSVFDVVKRVEVLEAENKRLQTKLSGIEDRTQEGRNAAPLTIGNQKDILLMDLENFGAPTKKSQAFSEKDSITQYVL